ncbi:Tn3 family transposase [Streptomyces sp. NPDC059575]|uniref:Tn3 family transposase n=1 Tax=Streptomyces sp. NPDC059575 TaxID=3346872 RepID=UPI003690965C
MALFNHAVTWLRRRRVLLPGVSVLARQVSEARTAAERRLYEAVARAADRADPALAPALAALLEVPEGRRVSELERLRTPPVKTTGTAMVRAMERVEEISAFALGRVNLSRVPVNRLSTLARYGQLSKAQTIERAPEPRRTALLTAVVRQLEAQAVDDALDLFALLMATRLISPARRASDRDRLAMLPQLEKAARVLAKASKILTEELDLVAEAGTDLDIAALWASVEEAVPRTAVAGAVATVEALVPEEDGSAEAAMREKLALRYNTVRPFLSLLGESDTLDAAPAGRRILKAVRRLPALSRRRVKDRPLLPREVDAERVPAMWKRAVFSNAKLPQGAVDRDGETPAAGYGPPEAIARNKVNLKRIETHWPDMLRVAGSLITNQVRAYDLLRMFGREGHPTPLGAAFAEYGRIDKTMHLLALVDPVDDTYRRLMNRQLTVQESRHRLARAICHGGRGQIRQAYREGQEDQLASLGLVLNAVVLWNTRYLDAAVARLRAEGHDIKDEDVARLSPLKDRHINFLGRYLFNIKASGPGQGLRPFRDPEAVEDDED